MKRSKYLALISTIAFFLLIANPTSAYYMKITNSTKVMTGMTCSSNSDVGLFMYNKNQCRQFNGLGTLQFTNMSLSDANCYIYIGAQDNRYCPTAVPAVTGVMEIFNYTIPANISTIDTLNFSVRAAPYSAGSGPNNQTASIGVWNYSTNAANISYTIDAAGYENFKWFFVNMSNIDVDTDSVFSNRVIYFWINSTNETVPANGLLTDYVQLDIGYTQVAQSISISASPSFYVNYPTSSTVSCSRIFGDPSSVLTLYRNGAVVVAGTSSPQFETTTLPIGVWNYTCTVSQTPDYAAETTQANLTVLGNQTALTMQVFPSEEFDYGANSKVYCDRKTGLSNQSITMWLDNVIVANGTDTPQVHNTTLSVGVHNYTCAVPASGDYGASVIETDVKVNGLTPSIALSASPSFCVYEGQGSTVSMARIAGDSSQVMYLYRNGSLVAQGTTTPIFETANLTAGNYSYIGVIAAGGSYNSKNTTEMILNVSNACPKVENEEIPQNMTGSAAFVSKFTNFIVSSRGAATFLLTFISAMAAYFLSEEFSLYITSALIFVCAIVGFFPLWIGIAGTAFGIIIAVLLGRSGK